MAGHNAILVPLPESAEPTGDDIEMLEAVCGAIVGLRFQGTRSWERDARALADEGWTVRARLMWVVEARKGREYEQASGRTRDEAFSHLHELTKVDDVARVP
jgi:hypothetical protein